MVSRSEAKVLLALSKNSRMGIAEISKEAKLSRQTVYRTMRKLEKDEVIKGFKADIYPSNVGLQLKLYVLAHATSHADTNSFASQIAELPEVSQAQIILGRYDLLIEAYVKNRREITKLIQALEKIPCIEKTETFVVSESIKYDMNSPINHILEESLSD